MPLNKLFLPLWSIIFVYISIVMVSSHFSNPQINTWSAVLKIPEMWLAALPVLLIFGHFYQKKLDRESRK